MFASQAASKLILAGEHAVVYGSPALTTRLSWFTRCSMTTTQTPMLHLSSLSQPLYWQPSDLPQHWQQLNARHRTWQQDPTTSILRQLTDLPLAVLAWWQQFYPLPNLSIRIDSDIPIGQGLGSSASVILAMLKALMQTTHTLLTQPQLQQAATQLEQLAHGHASGLDVAAILMADRLYWQSGQATVLPFMMLPGYLIDTGKATSSTADCVGWVKQQHAWDQRLWQQMQQSVKQLTHALTHHQPHHSVNAVHLLHQSLCHIGVVPNKVQAFAAEAQQQGWAGKVCGAGSITGEGAGFFWLLSDAPPDSLCQAYGYRYWPLHTLTQAQSI